LQPAVQRRSQHCRRQTHPFLLCFLRHGVGVRRKIMGNMFSITPPPSQDCTGLMGGPKTGRLWPPTFFLLLRGVPGPDRPKGILVVDDEPQVADTLRMVLALSGHSIDLADSADRALEMYQPAKYDLVISDYSLGKMNGLALARIIRERCATQPIILITAY